MEACATAHYWARELIKLSASPKQASEMISRTPVNPRSFKCFRNPDHPAQYLPVALGVHRDRPSDETLRTSPAQLRFMTMPSRYT
jgi:hypothetical protein